ncbi:MAG: PRC-barrel domain-containing protein [archaeon]
MDEITSKTNFEGAIRAGDIIGKKVINDKGLQVGKIGEILIDSSDLRLKGIIVKRGLIATDIFVDHNNIKNLSKDGVELLAAPFIESALIKVFDINGKQIGNVKSIKRVDNSYKILSIVMEQEAETLTPKQEIKKEAKAKAVKGIV